MWRQVVIVAVVAGVAGLAEVADSLSPPSQLEETRRGVVSTNDREAWAVDFLAQLGNGQPSGETVALVAAWQAEENTTAAFNPLATSQEMDGATQFNSHGVKNYASYEDGIAATVRTLQYDYPGYADILAGLRTDDPARALAGLTASPWAAEGGYGARVRALWEGESAVSLPTHADIIPDWRSHITAGFSTVNCTYWSFQFGCQHFGTDIGGQGEGTPVYAPVGGTYTGCQDNGDSGPYIGKWIEYTADDGAQFLINHFRDSPFCGAAPGTRIEAGAFIGTMRGDANHIHVQVGVGGVLVDFEEYERTH